MFGQRKDKRGRGKLWLAVPPRCTWQPGNVCWQHTEPEYMWQDAYWCRKAWTDARAVRHVYQRLTRDPVPPDLDSRVGRMLWARYVDDLHTICNYITRHL